MTDANNDGAPAPAETPERKKKRKQKRAADKRPQAPALDADGRERPRFVLDFPPDPELDVLVSAFERGNYGFVRSEAPKLAERATDPAIRDAALELRRRIDPDPLLAYLLGIAVALLVFLTTYVYATHRH